jgi:hypothetical protein
MSGIVVVVNIFGVIEALENVQRRCPVEHPGVMRQDDFRDDKAFGRRERPGIERQQVGVEKT